MKILRYFTILTTLLVGSTNSANASNESLLTRNVTFFQASQQHIRGSVTDAITGEVIPHCNITVAISSIGTSTNELGEFILQVHEFPTRLTISHVNYETYSLEILENKEITISLKPLTTVLEEVVVSASKRDALALRLAKKAFLKAESTSQSDSYGRAFYRQKSKNGKSYSEFSEIFYDIRYGTTGIKDWTIVEGRYALNDDVVVNRNFTIFSRLLKPLQPPTDDFIFPLHQDLEKYFKVRVRDIVQADEGKIAIVHFKPLETNSTPAFEGEVYINMNTFDLVKISGSLARDDLNLAKLTTKGASWKEYSISYDITYKIDSLSNSVLDYIKVDQAFDYYKNDSLQYRSQTTSNLTFYEHYTPASRERLGRRLRTNQSDWKKLDKIGYNEEFWADNPIVKRTPVEQEVIDDFELKGAFSTVFLNSSENISLMDSNVANDSLLKALAHSMSGHRNDHPVEKVHLHTDRDIASSGETLWYSAYVVLGPEYDYSAASRVLHVDLIGPDSEIIHSQTHKLFNGRGAGSILLPSDLSSGTYQLRSYTQWMRNFDSDFFFTKKLKVLGAESKFLVNEIEDKVDLQFFPEGGYLVRGLTAKVAFKAIGVDGQGRQIKGKIVDSAGEQVAVLMTFDRGGGFFQLKPMTGETYTAVLEDGTEYPLPKALPVGYSLTIDNLNKKSIRLIVQASDELQHKTFYIVAHNGLQNYYQGKFGFGKENDLRFEIPKTKMPSGLLTITLFDEENKAWSERPVFIDNQEGLHIATTLQQEELKKRGKTTLAVHIADQQGQPISTDFSISVTDAGQAKRSSGASNLTTQLLLQSDLKGFISDPALLFANKDRSTQNALDLVMLTHGWRRYQWPEILQKQNLAKDFPFAEGLVLAGTASEYGRPLSNRSLKIFAKSEERLDMHETTTSMDGSFVVSDLNFENMADIFFNTSNPSGKGTRVTVSIDSSSRNTPSAVFKSGANAITDQLENYSKYASTRAKMDFPNNFEGATKLENVTITEKRKEKSTETPSLYGIAPDHTVYGEDNRSYVSVFQMLQGLPGVSVIGSGSNAKVSIRNGGAPLWIVDGIHYLPEESTSSLGEANQAIGADESAAESEPSFGFSTGDESTSRVAAPAPSLISNLDVFSIQRIEVHKGVSAGAISGLRGQNGVIIIYTKSGNDLANYDLEVPPLKFVGHAGSKEFYAPKYDVPVEKHTAQDHRATLYWNPALKSDANGNATIEFFNSDLAKEIQISIEGLSPNGIPGSFLKSF